MRTLKQRLILVNIAATGLALLVAGTLMFNAELRTWREALVRDLTIKADIIGNQSTAALTFNAPADAVEILGALRADSQIEYAALYSRDGRLFAVYQWPGVTVRASQTPSEAEVLDLTSAHVDLTRSIFLRNERIGSITVRASLNQFHARMLQFIFGLSVIVLLSLAAVSMLLARLQRTVTAPVTDLVKLMESVSRDKDYRGRASGSGTEEFVTLAEGFNTMLSAIQSRDRDLEQSLLELKKAYENLEGLDRLKSDFISTVSHELRTPITSIKAFTELILMKPNMQKERQTQLLETINSETDRLARLIGDLLDLSRIEAGVILWRDEDLDMESVVRVAITGILPLAQRKEIRIEEHLEAGLATVHVDRDRITQVVMNVLSNAIKFTPAGGRITVEMNRVVSPPGLAVSVTDTGRGIPSRDLLMIFEKFRRSGDVLTSTVEGSGLGLSICRQIMEHYGGRIWAVSEEGAGSTFTFVIPISAPSFADGAAPEEQA